LWCHTELAVALELGKRVYSLDLSRDLTTNRVASDLQGIRLESTLEASIRRLIDALRHDGLGDRIVFRWDSRRPPYPGLAAMDVEDAGVFFGRDPDLATLLARVEGPVGRLDGDVVLVTGASGCGKSSLVRAGLVARLSSPQSRWVVLEAFEPGIQPLERLTTRMAEASQGQLSARDCRDRIDAVGLGALAEWLVDNVEPRARRLLITIDQVEQLVTATPADEREKFLAAVGRGLQPGSKITLVMTVRLDRYDQIQRLPVLGAAIKDPVILNPMDRSQLSSVIEGPAVRADLNVERALVGRLIDDAVKGGRDAVDALPLLAFTLRALYDKATTEQRRTMTERDYESVGSIDGAIAKRAQAAEAGLPPDSGSALEGLFARLVTVSEDRLPAGLPLRRERLTTKEAEIVGRLEDERLLIGTRDEVRLSHERLIEAWPRLRDFIERQRDALRLLGMVSRAARDWDQNGRVDSYLWPHERLQPVYEMIEQLRPTIDGVTEAFIRPEYERLLIVLGGDSTPEYQRAALADRLVAIGASAVPGLVHLLMVADERVRTAAASALGRIGYAAVPAVSQVATSAEIADSRLSAVGSLALIADDAATEVLVHCTADADPRVRSAAIGVLGSRPLTPVTEHALVAAVSDADTDVRWEAAGALAAFGSASVPSLVEKLGSDVPEVVDTAAKALLGLGSLALPVLSSSLGTGPARIREGVARVLVALGPEAGEFLASRSESSSLDEEWRLLSVLGAIGDPGHIERIRVGLRSTDAVVRSAAATALAKLADPKAIDSLLLLLDDLDIVVRDLAVDALAALGPVAVDPLADLLMSDPSDRVRRGCRLSLSRIGSPAVPRLIRELDTAEHSWEAELVLASFGSPAVPLLVSALASRSPDVVHAAKRVLVAIGQPARPELLLALANRQWTGFVAALDVVATMADELELANALATGLEDPDPVVREISIRGVAALGSRAVPMLTTRLSADDPILQASVVSAFTAIGGPGVPTLVERARNGHTAERVAAERALEQIMSPPAVFYTYQRVWETHHQPRTVIP
jgi:HEAT repeat protein